MQIRVKCQSLTAKETQLLDRANGMVFIVTPLHATEKVTFLLTASFIKEASDYYLVFDVNTDREL
jgi:hypothetical protein